MALQDGDPRSVESWIRDNISEAAPLPECGLVHRLDSGTTGCLVVALTRAERARLREAFADRTQGHVHKIYWAVVRRGLSPVGKFSLYFSGRHKRSAKVTVRPRGEPNELGECVWQVLGPSRYLGHEIVQVELVGPGRRHQIRAGLGYGGHPLIGDSLYGGAIGAPCPVLHAKSVHIDGVTVECPPDARFHGPDGTMPSKSPSPAAS